MARLAAGPPDDRTVLATARRARTDLDTAAAFVATGGVERLRRAVERTGTGRESLDAFERYRAACQFHPAHAIDIPTGPKDTPD
nr:hypothetical protein [Halomarina rubra]